MLALRWVNRKRNETDWLGSGWLIADVGIPAPTMLLMKGWPPIAVLPRTLGGEGREYVLGGMMLALAERFPEEPNPLLIWKAPSAASDVRVPHRQWGDGPYFEETDEEVAALVRRLLGHTS